MVKQKVYLLLENVDQLINLNMGLSTVLLLLIGFFQLIVLLKPDFNCFSSFALSWVDKVTASTSSILSAIANVGTWLLIWFAIVKQFANQVRIKLISQLINGN